MQLSQIDKKELRRLLINKRFNINEEKRELYSQKIGTFLYELIIRCNFQTVLLFSPVKGEPDVSPLTEALIKNSISVGFPVSLTQSTTLEFRKISSCQDLKLGAYNILEPDESSPVIGDFTNALCVVPAIAYDKSGMRLGYGKGYYDRFLGSNNITSVGVCYSDLLVDSLPFESTDIPVDIIITEGGVIFPNEVFHFYMEQNSQPGQKSPFKKR